MELRFYKSIGGYNGAILWRGRWYYTGETAAEARKLYEWAQRNGHTLRRKGGEPHPLGKLFRQHGRILGAWKKLPHFWALPIHRGEEEQRKGI